MQNKLFATLITALLVMLMAGSAMCATTYDSSVVLEEKEGFGENGAYSVVGNGINATVDYNAKGAEFEWHAYGTAKLANTSYVLIYYADRPDRFNATQWGGDNPGALIGTMTTDSNGAFDSGDLSVDLGHDLPHPDDYNAAPDPWDEYCNTSGRDGYDNCWGAKLWMIPATSYVEPKVETWDQTNFLFETNLIQYCRDCYAPQAIPDTATFSIGDVFGTDTVPIMILNATNAGSVDMTLTYDPAVVTVTVSGGDMDAEFWNIGTGQVRIGAYQTNNPGLNGDFVLAEVSFTPVDDGACDFGITVTTYKDATPCGRSMDYDVSTGVYCSYLNGDVNGDGLVDMFDAMYLAKHVIGISGFENVVECAVEVSGDGTLDIHDASYLAKHIIGIGGYEELN